MTDEEPLAPIAPSALDNSLSLDEVASRRPLARALLLADLLRARRVSIDAADRLERVGDVTELQRRGPSDSDAHDSFSRWPLVSPRATLRAVAPCDFASIHAALNDPRSSWRLPTRATTVLPQVADDVIDGADLQMVGAANRHPTRPVALMALHGHDSARRTADLTIIGLERDPVARARHRPHRALRFETAAMFVGYAFPTLHLETITASIAEFNWHYFADGEGVVFRHDGRLRGGHLAGGRRWDVHRISIHRDHWMEVEKWLVPSLERFVVDD